MLQRLGTEMTARATHPARWSPLSPDDLGGKEVNSVSKFTLKIGAPK